MAYKRSILTRVSRLRRQSSHPSLSYILHSDDEKSQSRNADTSGLQNYNLLQRGYHSSMNGASPGIHSLLLRQDCSYFSPALGSMCFSRNYSKAVGGGSDKVEYMQDVTEILTENGVETVSQAPDIATAITQVPGVSEVAIAAADSYAPVAALQYIIDGVHSFTGLNWWASIALTTLMIRGATVPLLVNQLKASAKLAKMRPQLEEIKQRMQDMAMDPNAVSEGRQQMNALFKKHGVTPFTPLKGLFIQGPVFISFFLAISNMAEKVPSFKQGGTLWFTDLTTPDALYVFPIMTALTFLITVEFNMQEGMEGNPVAGTMKTFSRIIGVLTVPFTMSFPKAIFCYWITSNVFSFTYGFVIKRPNVKKFLKLPAFPSSSPNTEQTKKPAFDLLSSFKFPKSVPEAEKEDPLKLTDRKISSSSIISQKIRNLEKQVKGRKKNKKR
ncbi:hypothetical protein ACHQM5_013993 [Ranunculus cassubicifolius]